MAPEEATGTEVDGQVEAEATDDTKQVEIGWANDLLEDFKPEGVEDKDNGETVDDPPPESDADAADPVDEKPDETAIEPDSISEADYARKVAIKGPDGAVSYKTVKQLIDEGMLEADYRRKTQEVGRQREQLKEDQAILSMLDGDKVARDYLMKRLDAIKAGKPMDATDDIDIPDEVLEQFPWMGKFKNKIMEHDAEISKSRTNREQTQANQTVGKIDSIMTAALTAVEKETGLKLEPGVFRARVGTNIRESLDDSVPEENRTPIVGQMMLADKNYFLSKARESYQQEIELAKEKAIDTAKQGRAKKAQKTTPLKGGGAAPPKGELAELELVKDKKGNPDLGAFLLNAHTKGGKGR